MRKWLTQIAEQRPLLMNASGLSLMILKPCGRLIAYCSNNSCLYFKEKEESLFPLKLDRYVNYVRVNREVKKDKI